MIKKLCAVITLLCFAHVSFGAPCVQGALELAAQVQAVGAVVTFAGSSDDPFNLRLPSTLGRVTGGRNAGQGTIVINIQDLHCHAEVQRNISGILQFLDTKYGLRDVFVEGGYGRLNTAWLDGIADPRLKKQMVNALLENGRLGGSEYYAITNGRHDLLTGLEDERLHKDNIVRLGSILERQPRFEAKLRELRRDLVVMKARYLSAENKRLDNILAKYRAGDMTDARLYALLSAYIDKVSARPDAYHSLQVLRKESFPTVQLYRETLTLQKRLRYSKVSAQLTAFMGTLKTRLSFAAYNDLLTRTDNLNDLDALAPALARVSRDHQLNMARYPDLAQFIAYREKTRAVNPMVLLRETRRMTDALRSAFARNSAERDIAFLCDTFDCFEDYLLNRLTAEDHAYFKPRFEQFSSVWGAYTYTNHIRDLAPDFPLLDAYYAANDRRNGVFIDTMAPSLRPRATDSKRASALDVVVMVSGGFHTEGVARLLAQRNISYCTITPAVTRPAVAARHVFEETIRYQSRLFGAQALSGTPLEALHPAVQVSPDGLVTVSLDGGARLIVNGDAFTVEGDISASAAASAARGLDFAAVQRNAEIIMRLLLTRQTPLSLVPALYELVDICGDMLAQKGAAGTGLLWDIASNPAVQQALADKGTSLNSISTWLEPLQALAAGYAVTQADMRTLRDDPATNSIVRAVLRVPYAIETLGALHVFKGPAGAEDFPRGLVIDASGYTVEQMSVEEYNTVNQADCSDLFGHYTFCVNINAETKTMTVISNSGYVNFEASELEEVKRRVVFLSSLFNRLQAGYRNDYDLHDIEVSEYLNIDYYPFTSVDTLSTTLYGFCAMPGPLSAISGTNFWERSSMGYVVNPQPIFVSPLEYPNLALSLSDIQSMSKNVRTEHRAKFIKWIVKYVQEKSVKPSILEIGCNVGRDLLALCDDEKWDLYGIDVEDGAIRTLRQNIDDLDMKGIDVARISIYSQNFADEIRREFNRETFDVILMFATFEHLQDPKKALRRINAMLRSGGAVAITALPDNGSLMTKLSGLASNADASKTTHCCIYSKESFEALARENGFTVLYYHGENNSFPGWEHTMFEEVLPFIRDGKWYFFGKPLPDGITFKSLFKDNDPPHYNVFHLPFRHGNASTAAWGLGNYKLYKRHRKHIERLIQKFFFETTRDDFVGNIDDAVAALNDHLFNTLILDNPTGITDDDFETLLACKNDEAKLREIFQRKYFTIRNMWCYLIKETDVNLHSVAGATDTHAGQVISSDYRQAPEVSLMSQSGKGAVPDATIPPQVKLGIAAGGHALTTRSTYRLAGWIAGKLHLSFAQGLPSDWYTPENRAKHLKMARFAERVVAPLAVWDLPAHLMWSLWNIVRGSDVKKNLIRVVGAVAILSATAGLILLAGGFVPVQSWIDMLPYAAGLIPYAGLHRGYNKLFGTGTTTDAPLTIDGGGNKDIAQKEFVKAIEANYDIVVDDIRPMADWTPTGIPPMLVRGADGKQYVCRKIDGVFGKTIRRAREVIEYQQVLSDHGIAVGRIHQTLNKNDFFIPRPGDDCYILEEYIPGETGSDMSMLYRMLNREAPASEQADNRREVIKWQLAAQLQNAVAGENLQIKSHHPPMEEGVVELNLAMKGLRVEISRAYSADSPEQQFFNAVAEVFERHYPRVPAKGLRGLPVSLIHGHMHLNSMQFDGEGNLVLLKNLEDVQVAPRVNEFINLLMPFDAVPDYHNFVTLITAYQAALDEKLSAEEILAIAHVVRFRLLHDIVKYFRKYDVLNNPAYENNRTVIMQAIKDRIAGCERFLDEFENNSHVLVRGLGKPAGNTSGTAKLKSIIPPAILPKNLSRVQERINQLILENQNRPAEEQWSDDQIARKVAKDVARWERWASLSPFFAWYHPLRERSGAAWVTLSFWGTLAIATAAAASVLHMAFPVVGILIGAAVGLIVRERVHSARDVPFLRDFTALLSAGSAVDDRELSPEVSTMENMSGDSPKTSAVSTTELLAEMGPTPLDYSLIPAPPGGYLSDPIGLLYRCFTILQDTGASPELKALAAHLLLNTLYRNAVGSGTSEKRIRRIIEDWCREDLRLSFLLKYRGVTLCHSFCRMIYMVPDSIVRRFDAQGQDLQFKFNALNDRAHDQRKYTGHLFEAQYLPVALIMEALAPGSMNSILGLISSQESQSNPNALMVIRFLVDKRQAMMSGEMVSLLAQSYAKIRDVATAANAGKRTGKIQITNFFKIISMGSRFVASKSSAEFKDILDRFSGTGREMPNVDAVINALYDSLAERFLKKLGKDIGAEKVVDGIEKIIPLNYADRIYIAQSFIKKDHPDVYPRFAGIVKSMLAGTFWDFIENTDQADATGRRIALHNKNVRAALADKGIDVDAYLGRTRRFADRVFEYGNENKNGTPRFFRLRPILRDPSHDLFLGDFTECCFAMNSDKKEDGKSYAVAERLVDEAMNVIEVLDEQGKTIAAMWLYIAADGSLFIDTMAMAYDYTVNKDFMDEVVRQQVQYARDFAKHIKAPQVVIVDHDFSKIFADGRYLRRMMGNGKILRKISFNDQKIGGYIGARYYFDFKPFHHRYVFNPEHYEPAQHPITPPRGQARMDFHFIHKDEITSTMQNWGALNISGSTLSVPVWMPQDGDFTGIAKEFGVTPVPLGINVKVNRSDDDRRKHQVFAAVTLDGHIMFGFAGGVSNIDPATVMREISRHLIALDGVEANPTVVDAMRQKVAAAAASCGIDTIDPATVIFNQLIIVDHVNRPHGRVSFKEGIMVVAGQSLSSGEIPARTSVEKLHQVNVSMGKHIILDACMPGTNVGKLLWQTGTASLILTKDQIAQIGVKRLEGLSAAGKFIYVSAEDFDDAAQAKTYVHSLRHLAGYVSKDGVTTRREGETKKKCRVITGTLQEVRTELDKNENDDPSSPVIIVLKPVLLQDGRTGILQLSALMDVVRLYHFDVLEQDTAFEQSIQQIINQQGVEAILRAA